MSIHRRNAKSRQQSLPVTWSRRVRRAVLERRRRAVAMITALVLPLAMALQLVSAAPSTAVPAPTGSGFTVTAGDLSFILKQIKIAERHAHTFTRTNPCGTLVGS